MARPALSNRHARLIKLPNQLTSALKAHKIYTWKITWNTLIDTWNYTRLLVTGTTIHADSDFFSKTWRGTRRVRKYIWSCWSQKNHVKTRYTNTELVRYEYLHTDAMPETQTRARVRLLPRGAKLDTRSPVEDQKRSPSKTSEPVVS